MNKNDGYIVITSWSPEKGEVNNVEDKCSLIYSENNQIKYLENKSVGAFFQACENQKNKIKEEQEARRKAKEQEEININRQIAINRADRQEAFEKAKQEEILKIRRQAVEHNISKQSVAHQDFKSEKISSPKSMAVNKSSDKLFFKIMLIIGIIGVVALAIFGKKETIVNDKSIIKQEQISDIKNVKIDDTKQEKVINAVNKSKTKPSNEKNSDVKSKAEAKKSEKSVRKDSVNINAEEELLLIKGL